MPDISARIAQLRIHPVKSCAGIDLSSSEITPTGLLWDRSWMVVDDAGEFVTQRELPRMALVQPTLRHSDLLLRAPGMLSLHLSLDGAESPCRVRVWDDEVEAYDMGDLAAQWFQDFLQPAAHGQAALGRLRLARFDPEVQRVCAPQWTGEAQAVTQFADGFSVLVTSVASLVDLNARLSAAGHAPVDMARFRSNVVIDGLNAFDEDRLHELRIETPQGPVRLRMVKPCARCSIPNVEPSSGLSSPEVGDVLQTYRQSSVVPGVTFGMNAIVVEGAGNTLAVGQTAEGDWRFD